MIDPPTDENLVLAASGGDTAAFGDLLQRHYSTLLRVCVQVTRDTVLAQDCAQDACFIALTRLSQLRSGTLFGAWLVGIGRHVCHHALRARTARQVEYAVTAAEVELIDTSALKVRLHEGRRILRHHFRLLDPPPVSRLPVPRVLAIHEAAHAVLHLRAGGALQRVSIKPVSAVWVAETGVGSQWRTLPAAVELQVRMAGEAATSMLSRRAAHVGRSGDRDSAGALAIDASDGDSLEAALLVDAAWRSARAALEDDRTWRHVQRVASTLIAVHTLYGDDVRQLCST